MNENQLSDSLNKLKVNIEHVENNVKDESSQVYDSLAEVLRRIVLYFALENYSHLTVKNDLNRIEKKNGNLTIKLIEHYVIDKNRTMANELIDSVKKIKDYRNDQQHPEQDIKLGKEIHKYDRFLVSNVIQTYNRFVKNCIKLKKQECMIDESILSYKDVRKAPDIDFGKSVAEQEIKRQQLEKHNQKLLNDNARLERINSNIEQERAQLRYDKNKVAEEKLKLKSEKEDFKYEKAKLVMAKAKLAYENDEDNKEHIAMFYSDYKEVKKDAVYFDTDNGILQKEYGLKYSDSCIIQTDTFELGKGFFIKDIQVTNKYSTNSIYAIIFNIMQRNRTIWKDEIVLEYEFEHSQILNYKYVYRYEMAILLMIKYNYTTINVYPVENYEDELKCAIYHINTMYEYIQSLVKNVTKLKRDIIIDYSGFGISFENCGDINVEDITDKRVVSYSDEQKHDDDDEFNRNVLLDRERIVWYSSNVVYNIEDSKEDDKILKYFLKILFGYDTFKDGQLDVIKNILNSRSNKMVLMPTGAGKSLIYYFVGMMQPGPLLIVEPTKILIKDQLRNLRDSHNIDDAIAYYDVFDDDIELNHKFIYITPTVMKSKRMLINLTEGNKKAVFSNVVLDEIHTISNWSHDFRPSYLRMSFNLNTFLDNFNFLGFTATADNKVIKDISTQFGIDYEDILVPIDIVNDNVSYEFKNFKTSSSFTRYFKSIAQKMVDTDDDDKMLVFTKSDEINKTLKSGFDENIKYDIDVFSEQDENSYKGFVTGRKCILITNSDMGIGINIPEVNKILHYGIPTSMVNYIQEMGRAGRSDNEAYSYIAYIDKSGLDTDDLNLLKLTTSIDEVLDIIKNSNSDIALAYKKILGDGMMSLGEAIDETIDACRRLKTEEWRSKNGKFLNKKMDDEDEETMKFEKCLFYLSKMGIVHNWNISNIKAQEKVCDYDVKLEDVINLTTIKDKTIDYMNQFSNAKKYIHQVEEAEDVNDVIRAYHQWYYNVVLMTHRERLVNMYDFIDNCNKNKVSDWQISDVLSLYFKNTGEDVEKGVKSEMESILAGEHEDTSTNEKRYYKSIGIKRNNESSISSENLIKVVDAAIKDAKDKNQNNFVRFGKFLEMKYDALVDCYILIFNIFNNDNFNRERFERIAEEVQSEIIVCDLILSFYEGITNISDKCYLINILLKKYSFEQILKKLFNNGIKDIVYYYYVASIINRKMGEFNGI